MLEVAGAFWTSVALFLGAGLVIMLIVIYNRLVSQRQNVKQGVADIDAQLRQRHAQSVVEICSVDADQVSLFKRDQIEKAFASYRSEPTAAG